MGVDPYWDWLRIPRHRRPPNYYDLLGLPEGERDQAKIEAAAMQRIDKVRGYAPKHTRQATRTLNELSRALACLSDPYKKAGYDREELGLSVPQGVEPPALPPAIPIPVGSPPGLPSGAQVGPISRAWRRHLAWQVPLAIAAVLVLLSGLLVLVLSRGGSGRGDDVSRVEAADVPPLPPEPVKPEKQSHPPKPESTEPPLPGPTKLKPPKLVPPKPEPPPPKPPTTPPKPQPPPPKPPTTPRSPNRRHTSRRRTSRPARRRCRCPTKPYARRLRPKSSSFCRWAFSRPRHPVRS